jgi:hypothetical protein
MHLGIGATSPTMSQRDNVVSSLVVGRLSHQSGRSRPKEDPQWAANAIENQDNGRENLYRVLRRASRSVELK